MTTSFLLDENVPATVIAALKSRGYHVRTVQEAFRTGLKNSEIAEIAQSTNEIVITFDSDFLKLKADLLNRVQVIFIDLHPRDPKKAAKLLDRYIDDCNSPS